MNAIVRSIQSNETMRGAIHLVKKYSPEILTGLGIVAGGTTVVLAAKATLKLEPVVDVLEANLSLVNEELADNPSKATRKRIGAYARFTLDLGKLYGPAITTGVFATTCIIGAHGIMQRRNVAVMAAYKTLEQGYNEYRRRVIEEFGEDKDEEFRLGLKEETRTVDGKKTKVLTKDPNGYSMYARFFDEGNENWEEEGEMNKLFILTQQSWANDKLKIQGYMLLNEVYEMLGLEQTSAGAVVGWALNNEGDTYIDFGIFDGTSERARAFVNNNEPAILLDFNVQGVVNHLIDEYRNTRRHGRS
jgi:hypothetical protein